MVASLWVDESEARHAPAVAEGDAFDEHGLGAKPETVVAVEHLVDDEDFLGLRVAREVVHAMIGVPRIGVPRD